MSASSLIGASAVELVLLGHFCLLYGLRLCTRSMVKTLVILSVSSVARVSVVETINKR